MWKPGTREEFMEAAVKSADFIRDGGLKEEPGYSQIEEAAWPFLERINRAGFLTLDSQGGEIIRERAYVSGLMYSEDVKRFVENLNLWSDKVAFFTLPVKEDFSSSIAVTKDFREDGLWHGFTSLPIYLNRYSDTMDKKRAGLAPKFPAITVNVFDPKWGRPAWSKNGLFKDILEALNPRERVQNELGDDPSE